MLLYILYIIHHSLCHYHYLISCKCHQCMGGYRGWGELGGFPPPILTRKFKQDLFTHRLIIGLVEYTATEPFWSIMTSFVRELNQQH